ncbi:hypothetical protein KJ059_08385 [Myxococcota bacterium]|nr:hypothetical protein [Myxococcota bacterium]MCZ7619942.1 hypothetical protein [Myxococcota bacterium]
MPSRSIRFAPALALLLLTAAQPARAVTKYVFSATTAAAGISFDSGVNVEFTGFLTDPALLPGKAVESTIEVTTLSIGGAAQSDVEATVRLRSNPPNRLEFFIRFLGANNPEISLLIDLPGGAGADFPEIDFDLAGVSLVAAEISEDGIEPVALNVASFYGTAASEYVVDGGFDDPAHPAWSFEKFDSSSTIAWNSADANGSPSSGSLSLDKAVGENPNSLRAAQCIDMIPGGEYALLGRLFWPSTSTDGEPFLTISFSEEPRCNGDNRGSTDVFIGAPLRDAWTQIGPTLIEVPLDARSGRFYSGVSVYVDPGSPDFFAASWDDVSLLPEPGSSAAIAVLGALAALAWRRRAARLIHESL